MQRKPCPAPERLSSLQLTTYKTVEGHVQDLPYGWATLVENVLDPAHINFSHHGVIGDRRAQLPEATGPRTQSHCPECLIQSQYAAQGVVADDVCMLWR